MRYLTVFILSFGLAACGLFGIGGPPRVTTPEERATATAALDVAVAAGKVPPLTEDHVRAMIEDSATNPLSRGALVQLLLALGLGCIGQRIDRGPPERVRQAKAKQAAIADLLAERSDP